MADWFLATEGVKIVKDSASLWPQIITAVSSAGAALGGVYFTHHLTHKRDKQKSEDARKKELHYIATELVFRLERYAEGCARVAEDNGCYSDTPQAELEPQTKEPALELADVSGDWRVLNERHLYRLREFPVLQEGANRAIAYAAEIPALPWHQDYFRERKYQFTRLGIRAVILAVRLRREVGLPETRLVDNEWSAVAVFRRVWRRERHRRTEEAIRIRNLHWHGDEPVVILRDNTESPAQ